MNALIRWGHSIARGGRRVTNSLALSQRKKRSTKTHSIFMFVEAQFIARFEADIALRGAENTSVNFPTEIESSEMDFNLVNLFEALKN